MTQGVPVQHFQNLSAHVRKLTEAHEALRKQNDEMRLHLRDLGTIEQVLNRVTMSTSGGGGGRGGPQNAPMVKVTGGGVMPIWDVPGKQIPYDFLVDIPINDNVTDTKSNTLYVTTEGPFIATARVAIVRSRYSFQYTPPDGRGGSGVAARFQGRSYGRYRPVHSAADITDAMNIWAQPSQYQPAYLGAVFDGSNVVAVGNPMGVNGGSGADGASSSADTTNMVPNFPGNGRPLNVSPVSMASARSMQLDATITVDVQGANFKRSNIAVPSAFWTGLYNSPWDLPAFDVFDPGETISIDVTPTHPNNPAYGNINGLMLRSDVFVYTPAGASAGGSTSNPAPAGVAGGGFPFSAGQFDAHEGINDESISGDVADTPDRVSRNADSILTIGFKGYKIIQSPQTLGRLGATYDPASTHAEAAWVSGRAPRRSAERAGRARRPASAALRRSGRDAGADGRSAARLVADVGERWAAAAHCHADGAPHGEPVHAHPPPDLRISVGAHVQDAAERVLPHADAFPTEPVQGDHRLLRGAARPGADHPGSGLLGGQAVGDHGLGHHPAGARARRHAVGVRHHGGREARAADRVRAGPGSCGRQHVLLVRARLQKDTLRDVLQPQQGESVRPGRGLGQGYAALPARSVRAQDRPLHHPGSRWEHGAGERRHLPAHPLPARLRPGGPEWVLPSGNPAGEVQPRNDAVTIFLPPRTPRSGARSRHQKKSSVSRTERGVLGGRRENPMSYSFGIDPPPPSPPPAPPADASAAGPTASDKAIAGVVIVGVVGFLGFILYTNYKIASAIAEREGSEGLIKYELGSAAIGIGSEMAYRGMRQNSHKRGRRALGAPVGNVHYGRFTKAEASAFRRGKLRKQIAKAKREGRDVTFREFFRPGVYEELFGSEREGT